LTLENGVIMTTFDHLAKMQGRYLPLEVRVTAEGRMLFSATADGVTSMDPADPAIKPTASAVEISAPSVFASRVVPEDDWLIKKVPPVYPPFAKSAGLKGSVILHATIGTDGSVHDVEAISSPAPPLTAAATDAVSQWKYRPYLLNGQPVEANTIIDVIFALPR
jgi:TonB family protein